MSNNSYRFRVGDIECVVISDGTFTYKPPTFPPPKDLLFANAPKEQLEQILRKHNLSEEWVEWTSHYLCLLINTGEHQVLVDTGAGDLGPNTGKLFQNLQELGVAPSEIDLVVLTHAHPDHIGGVVDGNFSNAKFIMWRGEWDFWMSEINPNDELKVLFHIAQKNLLPIQDQIYLIDGETEIRQGIYAMAAPGHTPGHMALSISSGNDQLLCLADAVLHPIHVEQPYWHAAVDFSPQEAIDTRQKLLNMATRDNTLTFAFHFPFPGLGNIIKIKDQWQWQPIKL